VTKVITAFDPDGHLVDHTLEAESKPDGLIWPLFVLFLIIGGRIIAHL